MWLVLDVFFPLCHLGDVLLNLQCWWPHLG